MTVADISSELTAISNAQYGSDVRQAMHDGLEKINNDLSILNGLGLEITAQSFSNVTLPANGYSSITITANGSKFPISVLLELTSRDSQAVLVGAPVKDGGSYNYMAIRLYNISNAQNTISGRLVITWAQLDSN